MGNYTATLGPKGQGADTYLTMLKHNLSDNRCLKIVTLPNSTTVQRANIPSETKAKQVAISLRDLTVSCQEKPVLRSISMDVPKGQIVGIVGPNGAGKSTLIQAMLGLVQPDAGQIRYYGRPISECRQLVGYVPQTESVDWDFPVTVLDVVLMGHFGRLKWQEGGANTVKKLSMLLRTVGMALSQPAHEQLSGGQQQRVFWLEHFAKRRKFSFLMNLLEEWTQLQKRQFFR